MIEKFRTLVWFIRRPLFWSHAWALLLRKLKPNQDTENLRAAAGKWASDQAVSQVKAYQALGLSPPSEVDLQFLEELLADGRDRAQQSNIQMGGPGAIEFLYGCALALAAERVVETGVAYGWSSLALLAAMQRLGQGHLVSVDMPYVKAGNEPWVGIAVPPQLRSHWALIREPDRNGLTKAIASQPKASLDLVHYDSDKSYWGRQWAYPRLWAALRPGGVFISDDIQDNHYFRQFCLELGLSSIVIEYDRKFVGCLRKPAATDG